MLTGSDLRYRWDAGDDAIIRFQWRTQMNRAYNIAIATAKKVHKKEKRRIQWLCEPFFEDLKAYWDYDKTERHSLQAGRNRRKTQKGTYSGGSHTMAETRVVMVEEMGVPVSDISFMDYFIATHMSVQEDDSKRWVHLLW